MSGVRLCFEFAPPIFILFLTTPSLHVPNSPIKCSLKGRGKNDEVEMVGELSIRGESISEERGEIKTKANMNSYGARRAVSDLVPCCDNVAVLLCLSDVPLWQSTRKRPMATKHSPPMNVNVQPIPIASSMSCRNDTATAAIVQRTMLLEA